MLSPTALLVLLIVVSIALVLLVAFHPTLTISRGGKIVAFMALFLLPVITLSWGTEEHMERSKQTSFCLSCHVMHPYGESLRVADTSYLAAAHYLNNRVPRDQACYTCHTDYVIYGGIRSKLRGLRHVWVQYVGTPPGKISLYTPYNNRECLHCHEGARSFEEGAIHNADPETLPAIRANKLSCISSGCHDTVHKVDTLSKTKLWQEPKR